MDKKYEILTNESIEFDGRKLYRIRALKDFGDVHKGQIGGYVMSEDNLSHDGDCWVYDDAKCMDNAKVCDNAKMFDNACMYHYSAIYDNSRMCNKSCMYGESSMYDCSAMYDNGAMYEKSKMRGNSKIYRNSILYNDSVLKNNMVLHGSLYSKCDDLYNFIGNNGCRNVLAILKNGQILYNVGCQIEIDEKTFLYRIYNHNGGIEKNPYRKEYLKIIEMSKIVLK